MVTFEYALIEGINDSDQEASELAVLARKTRAKINLIPCSPNMSTEYRGSERRRLISFRDIMRAQGAAVTVRNSKGSDIQAACGQLAFDRNSR
jgi:23S rRNA (adenine2503-C2)-methyltransferase